MTGLLRRTIRTSRCGLLVVCFAVVCSGCATTASLESARHAFHRGDLERADQALSQGTIPEKDGVLFLMERGTIRQARGAYESSSRDLISAANLVDRLETYSVSEGGATWLINDTLYSFRGKPYERTMLHSLTALNHLAQGQWDDAAVEARRIIASMSAAERSEGYPDDPSARYIAGLSLELIDDPSNAALQYRKANELLEEAAIDEKTGIPGPPTPVDPGAKGGHELVCVLLLGRSMSGNHVPAVSNHRSAVYAEIQHRGTTLGRSYNLVDTWSLTYRTDQHDATRKAVKTAARVALKETLAQSLEGKWGDSGGDLVRLLLIGLLEQPDTRRWETLPRYIQVARVPCPPDLEAYTVVVKSSDGRVLRRFEVDRPPARRRGTLVSLCRDIRN